MPSDDAHGSLLVPPDQLVPGSPAAPLTTFASDAAEQDVLVLDLDPVLWPQWAVIWYCGMGGLAAVMLITYLAVAARQKLVMDDQIMAYQRLMRNLGFLVVLLSSVVHCFLPCQQVGRYVWWDTVFCSALVSRGLAATSELCWAAQVATGLLSCENEIYRAKYGPSDPGNFSWHFFAQAAVKTMVLLAVAAQGFALCATATRRYLWFACTEYCWGLAFLAIVPVGVYVFGEARRLGRVAGGREGETPAPEDGCCSRRCCVYDAEAFGLMLTVFCAMYLPWVFIADAPLYLDYWQRQRGEAEATWIPDLDSELSGFREGLRGALYERNFSREWEVWWPGIVCRSLHFAVVCWTSIAMSRAPRLGAEQLDRAAYSLLGDPVRAGDNSD